MSRRVVAAAYGGPENLEVQTYDPGAPGAGQVLLDVRAAGVNPIDVKLYQAVADRPQPPLPVPLGFEVSGVVRAVGPEVAGVAVGDEVIAYRVTGGYAAALVAPAPDVVPKPATLSFEQAAGLLLTGATAVHGLSVIGIDALGKSSGAGDVVLVHAAAGGVGQLAVQLAVRAGARVIGTASERNHDLLRRLGAEPVTYGPGLADRVRALAPGGVDAAFDGIGGDEPIDVSLELLGDKERFVTIVVGPRSTELGLKRIGGAPGADPGTEIRNAARAPLAELAGAGELEVVLAGSFPLDRADEAHRQILTRHTVGKLVLIP
ncbi:NADP-dependent oxidoreductase [Spongisporangium articulatum]|uniref:NADP-dependent oxidoreductase n=1 Tax=Spongisporangium articulatum TaxID=3362603 RepID=A0ABW8AQ75_9ACTN